ncbi:MAG: polysaccharide pyruvyl transferase family protein, partial [Acutalibacteraceae bacterium]
KDADAVMFAGGGFLKFRTQGLNYYVEQIIKIAEKKGIPVMMNGVGIEGYDSEDIRCQKLKAAINKDVVKIITTRDDIDTLQNNYIYNKNIITSRVGDPALWTPECYGVKRSHKRKKIGINLIRGNVFQDYGNSLSALQLKNFYLKLIRGIESRGWDWVLFSNGMKGDQVFGAKMCKDLGVSVNKKLCPAPRTSMELLDLVRSFKVVFGARLHACITSYSIDVPVVGLIWSEKSQIFCDVIGKPENYFKEDELDIETILDTIEKNFDEEYDKGIRDELKELTNKYVKIFVESIPEREVAE